jgi:hypothetical protein
MTDPRRDTAREVAEKAAHVQATQEMAMHLYQVHDGGEIYQYAATSQEDAEQQHRQYNKDCGVGEEEYSIDSVVPVGDDVEITILDVGPNGESVTKTAQVWAADGPGQVGSTAL